MAVRWGFVFEVGKTENRRGLYLPRNIIYKSKSRVGSRGSLKHIIQVELATHLVSTLATQGFAMDAPELETHFLDKNGLVTPPTGRGADVR